MRFQISFLRNLKTHCYVHCIKCLGDAGAHNQINNQSHRSMVMASTSAVNSIVTGLENSSMYTGDIIKITVTAKDSSGNFVTTGGDIFTVKISNLWTKYNAYYCWPNGATGPLSANVNDVMADHNNGTNSKDKADI